MAIINKKNIEKELKLAGDFFSCQSIFWLNIGRMMLGWLGVVKGGTTKLMYRQRGRFSQSFVNLSMAFMSFLAIVFSGKIEDLVSHRGGDTGGSNYLIMATDGIGGADTQISMLPKGEITEYRVQEGDTVSSIARKFNVSIDTIVWENNLKSVDAIKVNQILKILPETGMQHTVKRGETVHSIAKRYQVDPQAIIDYPFNTFVDDETFALAAGQVMFIPEGIKPKEVVIDTNRYVASRSVAPIPGVVGEGNFMWPTSGKISQRYYWYHRAVDIASSGGPAILASQGGTVTQAGWNSGGYGNYVVIDHGNGYSTLYAHMAHGSIGVKAGDRVTQGQRLGTMGSTGRSTGPHLHFEVNGPAGRMDPLTVLK